MRSNADAHRHDGLVTPVAPTGSTETKLKVEYSFVTGNINAKYQDGAV
jgi:hypothetical protein